MKESKMVEAIGNVDDKYINEVLNIRIRRTKMFRSFSGMITAAACCVLVFATAMLLNKDVPDSVVSIDVNPSIELTVNEDDVVVAATGINEDAKIVLEGMELKDVELNTALNAIVGSMLKNGYLDEVTNAVNICVENGDAKRADELSQKVSGEINSIFAQNDLIGNVNTQTLSDDGKERKLAEEYGVSVGKMYLAQNVADNTGIPMEEVINFSVSELCDLSEAEDVNLISKEDALKIVIEDAGINEDEITEISIKFKVTAGVVKCDIKVKVGERKEYKYKLDAETGIILEYEFKLHPEKKHEEPIPANQISKTEALAIACADASVSQDEIKLEELKHRPVEKEYIIEFVVGLHKYIYAIDAVEGTIISKEVLDYSDDGDTSDNTNITAEISFDEALKKALEMAGVKFDDLTMCDIKYHVHKNKEVHYRIHFHVDKEHYEFVVDAITGKCEEKKRPQPPTPPHEKDEPKPEEPVKPEPPEKPEKPAKPDKPEKVEKPKPEPPKPPHEKVDEEKPSEEATETPSEEATETPSEETTETPSEETTETPDAGAAEAKPEAKRPAPAHKKD